MSTIFPGSASVNQEFNGYRYNGTSWDIIGQEYNPTVYSGTEPLSPKAGDIWIDSSTNVPSISPESILTISSASSTYLTQTSASTNYLTQASASTNYLTKASASTTYATQADFPAGAWQSYTPVWGSNGTQPTLNNGTISGSYTRIGKTIHYRIQMTIGSTSSLGTGTRYTFTLPSTNKNLYPMATGFYFDTSTNTWYSVWGRTTSTAVDTLWVAAGPNGLTGGTLGAANPVVPASGDIYFMNGTYEEA